MLSSCCDKQQGFGDGCSSYPGNETLASGRFLMGEGFMGGGVHPPFTIFFDFQLRSLRYEKDFLSVLSKLSRASMVKIFHFSDEWKVVSVALQRGGCTHHINLEMFF